MINLEPRVKTSKPPKTENAVVEIWDEGGSLIGVIEPCKQKQPNASVAPGGIGNEAYKS